MNSETPSVSVPERRDGGCRILTGSCILITGGTGSFGNRIAGYLLTSKPREIRILSRDEKKQWEMQRLFPAFRYMIGDVRDEQCLMDAMQGVDYVFHAAALKQVPACEMHPWEAIKTNSIGAHNVCRIARRAGVRVVVALSTDKAVKPINAMGMSKALMEKLVSSYNQFCSDTTFCCVRYGNVMGTRGSVIALFKRLIAEGKPLTITVPQMTRFLITLDQSVELVLHAMTTSKGGQIFVRKAPACTVIDLARAMVQKYSQLGLRHPIVEIGFRPGEKLHEVLVNEYEMRRATETEEHFTIYPEYADESMPNHRPPGYEYTSSNTRQITNLDEICELLDAMGDAECYI